MELGEFLFGAFIYLAAAVISVPIATRLGLGSVLGYLIAGIVMGPAFLGLVGREGEDVMHFAEFGVIVMLFLVGLEVQPSKLWRLRRAILGLGGAQVVGTAAALAAGAYAIGIEWRPALAIGLILAMSSTAIILQSLAERKLLKTAAGQATFSVLLFQDIAVIPILAILPLLAGAGAVQAESHAGSLVGSLPAWAEALAVVGAVAAIIVVGRLLRPFFRFVAETGLREIFVAFALLIIVGITLLMEQVGLSPALGTFLAGVVLAESEYRHELEKDLEPFKGLLLAVFFIAVGAGINFSLLLSSPFLIAGLLAGFILVKLIVQVAIARGFAMTWPETSLFSFSLAQGGEFAFLLISYAATLGLLAASHAGVMVMLVALSMAVAPLLMIVDQRVIQPRFRRSTDGPADTIDETGGTAIIAGHGRFGMTVGRMLQANGFKAVVLDHDAAQIEALRRYGFKLFYGDASRLDLLEAAGAKEAKVLVIAIDDREKTLEIANTARRAFPHLTIFLRAFDRPHAYELLAAGFDHVYRELFGSSVDMGQDVLVALGKHPYEALRAARTFRHHDEHLVRDSARHRDDEQVLIDLSRQARAEIGRVLSGDRREAGMSESEPWAPPDRRE
jgi:monovalent cation:proton antiporter-2 (CPA2) family protein